VNGYKEKKMQRIAVPSYFYPCGGADPNWSAVINSAPTVGIAIINPSSGPGLHEDPNYSLQVKQLQKHGIKVLGYVHTSYATRPQDIVMNEMDKYKEWYSVDGIFLDEIPTDPSFIFYFLNLRRHAGSSMVVINPGTQTCEQYAKVADVVCNYEDNAGRYLSSGYRDQEWVKRYPALKFWHIVHSVSNTKELKKVLKNSKKRNAGWLFVTSEVMPNPYGKMPCESFWKEEVQSCTGQSEKKQR